MLRPWLALTFTLSATIAWAQPNDKGANKTLLQLIREKNAAQGKPGAPRADLRFGRGPNGQVFIMNKRDGVIRLLVP